MNSLLYKIVYGGGLVFNLAKWVVVASILIVLVNSFWVSIFIVDGHSMEPSLHNGEVVLMDKSFFRGDKKPQRGDSVVVKYPGDPTNKRYVKRVIGLPNETLSIKNGIIYINDKKLPEAYIPSYVETSPNGSWQMNNDQYFLMGDNRGNSNDSRYFGPVEQRFFVGKAVNVVMPVLRAIETPAYSSGYAGYLYSLAN